MWFVLLQGTNEARFPHRVKIEFIANDNGAFGGLFVTKTLPASCFKKGYNLVTIKLADLSMYPRPHNIPGYMVFKKKIAKGTKVLTSACYMYIMTS